MPATGLHWQHWFVDGVSSQVVYIEVIKIKIIHPVRHQSRSTGHKNIFFPLCVLALMHLLCCSVMNHSFHAYLFLLLSLGTKPECINRQIWMKRLFPNSAQRYFFSCLLNIAGAQHLFPPTHSLTTPPHPSQASLKKFLDYIQTGTIEKMAKVLDKGLDPNFHDPDNGGEFSLGK